MTPVARDGARGTTVRVGPTAPLKINPVIGKQTKQHIVQGFARVPVTVLAVDGTLVPEDDRARRRAHIMMTPGEPHGCRLHFDSGHAKCREAPFPALQVTVVHDLLATLSEATHTPVDALAENKSLGVAPGKDAFVLRIESHSHGVVNGGGTTDKVEDNEEDDSPAQEQPEQADWVVMCGSNIVRDVLVLSMRSFAVMAKQTKNLADKHEQTVHHDDDRHDDKSNHVGDHDAPCVHGCPDGPPSSATPAQQSRKATPPHLFVPGAAAFTRDPVRVLGVDDSSAHNIQWLQTQVDGSDAVRTEAAGALVFQRTDLQEDLYLPLRVEFDFGPVAHCTIQVPPPLTTEELVARHREAGQGQFSLVYPDQDTAAVLTMNHLTGVVLTHEVVEDDFPVTRRLGACTWSEYISGRTLSSTEADSTITLRFVVRGDSGDVEHMFGLRALGARQVQAALATAEMFAAAHAE